MRPAEDIERLLTELRDHASASLDQRTLRAMFSALDKSISETPARSWRDTGRAIMNSRITKLAAAVLILAVLLLARHLTGRGGAVPPDDRAKTLAEFPRNEDVPAPAVTPQEQERVRLTQELAVARELFAGTDVKGLLQLLDTGLEPTQVAVAGYLAQMEEESAVPALQRLADQWRGPAAENPFRRSVERIQNVAPGKDETAPQSPSPERTKPGGSAVVPDGSHVVVRVTDRTTGEPIPQAAIEVQMAGQLRTYAADDRGVFVLDLGASVPDLLIITVPRKGYVLQGVTLRGLSREMLPKTIQFSLEEGVAVGGMVQDSNGRPVEGATVEANFTEQKLPDEPWSTVRIEEKTDAQGRWRAANVPQAISGLGFSVHHPDFAEGSFRVPVELGMNDLWAQRAVMVLDEGVALTGRVTDIAGAPVAGARLLVGRLGPQSSWAQTDAGGRFEFPHLRTPLPFLLLTVQIPGFTPQRRVLHMEQISTPVEFVLKPAQLLIGRVVDSAGKPVEDASVAAQAWEGSRTLQWASRTDAKGMFLWDYPPDNAVVIRITKPGCREFQRPVVATAREQTFVLTKPATIQGTVLDSRTREPVKRFRVTPGIWWQHGNQLSIWQPADSWGKWFTDGRYSFTFEGDGRFYAVRVEADGYLPFESRYVDGNDLDTTIDIALAKGEGPSGYVFDANGAPVGGVEVFWQEVRGTPTHLEKNIPDAVYATTDAQGHFVFKPENRKDPFAVFCDQGMATVSYEDLIRDRRITLTPWARVQGDLHIGTKPAAKRPIYLKHRLSGVKGMTYGTRTDENGWFVFKRIYPGEFTLYDRRYEIAAGQTLELHLGATGRTVRGELAMPGAPDTPIQIDLILMPAQAQALSEGFPWPAGYEQMSFSELRRWFREFIRSPEGEAYNARHEEMYKSYRIEMDGQRTFHADDVEPGVYFLSGDIYRSLRSLVTRSEVIGRVWHRLKVPPLTSVADLDVPLDFGILAVRPGRLKPGDPAPDFDVPAVGTGRVRLADYRGKVLLVTFLHWGSVDPDSKDLLDLKSIYQRFRDDPRYAQVSLQSAWVDLLDEKAIQEAHLDWLHGLPEEGGDREAMEYGCESTPWNVLIGPQGQVLAVGLSGEALSQAIDEALQAAR